MSTTKIWLAAATTMMHHHVDAWDHDVFKTVVSHLGSSDLVYNSISFYIQTNPQLLDDFLTSMFKTLDPERVLLEVKKLAPVHFIRQYLESAQERNSRRVNEAINKLYMEEEDFTALRDSVERFDNFDSAELSAELEKMELFEFRKIALFLHRRNKRFTHAVAVAEGEQTLPGCH
ncbi:putative clathrin heavy chain [Trypanosoma cruzi]|uniref:Putative clathrin heavy chain n=1 Tax=Trypanosoma cruzi TaxID=5693 RepID=A0A2V2V4M8_TRYCR|nr:putative clathrin heavy chain [Trypanosoma cruzi]